MADCSCYCHGYFCKLAGQIQTSRRNVTSNETSRQEFIEVKQDKIKWKRFIFVWISFDFKLRLPLKISIFLKTNLMWMNFSPLLVYPAFCQGIKIGFYLFFTENMWPITIWALNCSAVGIDIDVNVMWNHHHWVIKRSWMTDQEIHRSPDI
jgi:hypothetical protein